MNDHDTLMLIHSVAWPTLLTLLVIFRMKRPPSVLAEHIWWFNNKPTWILHVQAQQGPKQ
jgi:hypothetical protein